MKVTEGDNGGSWVKGAQVFAECGLFLQANSEVSYSFQQRRSIINSGVDFLTLLLSVHSVSTCFPSASLVAWSSRHVNDETQQRDSAGRKQFCKRKTTAQFCYNLYPTLICYCCWKLETEDFTLLKSQDNGKSETLCTTVLQKWSCLSWKKILHFFFMSVNSVNSTTLCKIMTFFLFAQSP